MVRVGGTPLGTGVIQITADIRDAILAIKYKLTAECQRATDAIKKHFDTLGKRLEAKLPTQMQAVARSAADKAITQVERFRDRLKLLWHHIQHYLSFTIGVQIVMRSIRALQQTIDLFTEFEKRVVMAAAVSGYFGKAFDVATASIQRLALTLSRRTIYSANEIAEAMYSIASAGYDVGKITERELIPILNYAAAQQIDLNDATELVIKTFKEFGDTGETIESIVDKFTAAISNSFLNAQRLAEGMKYVGAMAAEVGVSLDETLGALAVLVDRGYEGSQAGQRLNMILTKLLKPTEEAKEALNSLGLTIEDLNPETNSLVEILYKLRAAGFSAAEASAMFRARTAAAALTLVENADAVARLTMQLQYSAGLTEELARRQINTLSGALALLRNNVVALAIAIGRDLKPLILTTAGAIEDYLLPVVRALSAPLSAFGTILSRASGGGKAFIGILLSMTVAGVATLGLLKMLSFTLKLVGKEFIAESIKAATFRKSLTALGVGVGSFINQALNLQSTASLVALSFGMITGELLLFATLGDKIPSSIQSITVSLTFLITVLLNLKNTAISARTAMLSIVPAIVGVSAAAAATNLAGMNSILGKTIATITSLSGSLISLGLTFKLVGISATSLLGIFGILITVGTIIASIWGKDIANALQGVYERLVPWESRTYKAVVASRKLSEALSEYRSHISTLRELQEEHDRLNKELEEAKAAGEDVAEVLERLNEVEKEMQATSNNVASSWKNIVSIIANATPNLGKYVKSLEDYYSTSSELRNLEERKAELYAELEKKQDEYSKAVAIYGAASEEARSIWNDIIRISRDYSDVVDQIADKEGELNKLEDQRKDIMDDLVKGEKELAEAADDLYEAHYNYVELMSKRIITESKLEALESLRSDINKILTEKIGKLAEAELKLKKIEEALYKLRKDNLSRVRSLWDALVKEGWITEDMIEGKEDLEKAYGDLMKAQVRYSRLLGRLTPEQREILSRWVEEYVKALEEGLPTPEVPSFLTGEDIDIALEYANAQYELRQAISSLQSILLETVDSLVEHGLVSGEIADAYYDLLGLIDEIKSKEAEYQEALDETDLGISSLTETMWNYWMSLRDVEGEPIQETFMEAAAGLGIFTDALYDSDRMLQYIRDILQDQTITWDTLTDEQAVAALTLGTLSWKYLELYNVIKAHDILELIPGADSWDGFMQAVSEMKTRALPPLWELEGTLNGIDLALQKIQEKSTIDVKINFRTVGPSEAALQALLAGFAAVPPIGLGMWLGRAIAGIFGGQYGGLVKKPTLALIGEAGPELVLPLKYPRRTMTLLSYVLPRYLKSLPTAQYGGLYTATTPASTYNTENINILGPMYVEAGGDINEFLYNLKYAARMAAP